MKTISFLSFLGLISLFAGCISYQYNGKIAATGSSLENIKTYYDTTQIKRQYTILGQATISGDYKEVSRDRLLARLNKEALKCGADAIIIREQQVMPTGENVRKTSNFVSETAFDSANENWNQLTHNIDGNYTNDRRNQTASTVGSNNNFERTILAEFIKYENPAK